MFSSTRDFLADIDRMTGLSGLILAPDAAVGKPEPSSWGLLGTKVGDRSAFCVRNVDFAFVWTCLSHGFHSTREFSGFLGTD